MIDLLMITHNRLEYFKKALPNVLNQTYKDFKLTIWDNASDKETIEYLLGIKSPKLKCLNLNSKNESLAKVSSEVFLNSKAEFVGKVDSDIIFPPDYLERLVNAHQKYHFGFLGGFHFRPEDLNGIKPNIEDFGSISIWRKHHIGGNYIIRRNDFKGYKGEGVMGLSEYQAEMGLINGYLWNPILWVEHLEDARSPYYINTKEYDDYKKKTRGITLEQYQAGIINSDYMRENTL